MFEQKDWFDWFEKTVKTKERVEDKSSELLFH